MITSVFIGINMFDKTIVNVDTQIVGRMNDYILF